MPLHALQRPNWHGTPIQVGDLFRLTKNRREARAALFTHQLGWEVRLLVGSQLEVVQTQVCRDQEEVAEDGRGVEEGDGGEGVAINHQPMRTILTTRNVHRPPHLTLFARIRSLSSALVLTTLAVAAGPVLTQVTDWTLVNASSGYAMEAAGDVLTPEGAAVVVRSTRTTTLPSSRAVTRLKAEPFRHRRVTVTGHVETQAVTGAAWLLAEVERSGGEPMVFNSFAQRLQGDNSPTPLTFTFPVSADATEIVVGLALRGDGTARAKQLRVIVGESFDGNGAVAPEMEKLLNAAIDIARREALKRESVDWPRVTQEMFVLAAVTGDTPGAYTAIRYLVGSLRDGHSFFLTPADAKLTTGGSAVNPPVEVKALEGAIGYISLPGYAGGSSDAAQAHVSRAYQQLSVVAPDARCGWVLDLRANGGGNVWPMVAVLRPFLGPEPMEQKIEAELEPQLANALNDAPVAVIIGPRTASAGEGVALRFRGRHRSRIFGQASAGQTTANQLFPLPDGSALALAVRLMRDRTGRSYGGPIEPDEIALSPSTAPGYASSTDEAVSATTRWLHQESRCGGL